jgi:hypothetical protein
MPGRGKIKFEVIYYVNGNLYQKTLIDTIDLAGSKVDLYFFKKHFDIPYHLPEKFIDHKYKSETITRWANGVAEKDLQTNWKLTFTYDNLSRVVNYTYSSCVACNDLPRSYDVTYNKLGLVAMITSVSNLGIEETYKIYYDAKGSVKQLDLMVFDKLDKQIIRQ